MSLKAIRIIAMFLCLTIFFSGCVSVDKSANKSDPAKKIVYVVEDEEINDHYMNQDGDKDARK